MTPVASQPLPAVLSPIPGTFHETLNHYPNCTLPSSSNSNTMNPSSSMDPNTQQHLQALWASLLMAQQQQQQNNNGNSVLLPTTTSSGTTNPQTTNAAEEPQQQPQVSFFPSLFADAAASVSSSTTSSSNSNNDSMNQSNHSCFSSSSSSSSSLQNSNHYEHLLKQQQAATATQGVSSTAQLVVLASPRSASAQEYSYLRQDAVQQPYQEGVQKKKQASPVPHKKKQVSKHRNSSSRKPEPQQLSSSKTNAILPALSPYNLFFRDERERLLEQAAQQPTPSAHNNEW